MIERDQWRGEKAAAFHALLGVARGPACKAGLVEYAETDDAYTVAVHAGRRLLTLTQHPGGAMEIDDQTIGPDGQVSCEVWKTSGTDTVTQITEQFCLSGKSIVRVSRTAWDYKDQGTVDRMRQRVGGVLREAGLRLADKPRNLQPPPLLQLR
ncbi:MAG: hypothetical protein AB7H77_07595 [Bdellovibrionales bacterium]